MQNTFSEHRISKSISLLKDVDTNIFEKLTESEKDNLRGQLSRLSTVVDRFDTMINDEGPSDGSALTEGSSASVAAVKKLLSMQMRSRDFLLQKGALMNQL